MMLQPDRACRSLTVAPPCPIILPARAAATLSRFCCGFFPDCCCFCGGDGGDCCSTGDVSDLDAFPFLPPLLLRRLPDVVVGWVGWVTTAAPASAAALACAASCGRHHIIRAQCQQEHEHKGDDKGYATSKAINAGA